MKKHVSFIVAILISLSSLAAPWDTKVLPDKMEAFTDPFLTDLSITENNVPHRLDISVTMDHSVNYTIKVVFLVYGNWINLGWDWRQFDVYVSPYNTYKLQQFSLNTYDDPWPESYIILENGPA